MNEANTSGKRGQVMIRGHAEELIQSADAAPLAAALHRGGRGGIAEGCGAAGAQIRDRTLGRGPGRDGAGSAPDSAQRAAPPSPCASTLASGRVSSRWTAARSASVRSASSTRAAQSRNFSTSSASVNGFCG
jgi:hypothetical protein